MLFFGAIYYSSSSPPSVSLTSAHGVLIKRMNDAQKDARGWLELFVERQKEGRQNNLKAAH